MRTFSYLSQWAFVLVGLFSVSAVAQVSPSSAQNYVVEQTPRTAQSSVSLSSSYLDVQAAVSYVDGLGRELQTIQVRGAGDAGADIVTKAVTYDAYGRLSQTYLPVPGGVGGTILSTPQSAGSSFYGDTNPYQETIYEASPQDRPTQQWGAGQNWRSANKRQMVSYGVAPANSVIHFKINLFSKSIYGNVEGGAGWDYFGSHDIATRSLTDEQNHQVIEYTDIQGRLIRRDVLVGSDTLTTMYVYDSYERLGVVIPPKLYNWFVAKGSGQALSFYLDNSDTPNPVFTQSCYVYLYDTRGRLIGKHVPSAGWTDLVYDQQDRLVMSRDQQDVADEVWRYIRYDGLNRQTQTGRWPLGRSADELRGDFTQVSHEDFPSTAVFPAISLLTESVYDTYTDSPLSFDSGNAYATPWPSAAQPNARGLLTRTGVRDLATDGWYNSAFWYDDKGRVIQSKNQNHLGGVNLVNNQYRFNGELLARKISEDLTAYSLSPSSVETYTYDHLSRPVSVSYATDGTPFEMARYVYDGIGRLSQKLIKPVGGSSGGGNSITRYANPPIGTTLDQAPDFVEILPNEFDVNFQSNPGGIYEAKIGISTGGVTALQTLDFRYHIRGWLKGVNVDASGQPALNSSQHDLFSFGLAYETAGYYDGSIGSQQWVGNQQPSQTRQYTYAYDSAKRLSTATYIGASGENYSLTGMGYDANGNITNLSRTGIDQLSYTYSLSALSNQVAAITDASSNTAGFADGHTGSDDYAYWPDGSLKTDLNRGISQIQYNVVKLPKQITFSSGKVVSFTYTATGQKLRMAVNDGTWRDYLPHSEHVNGQFGHMLTPEGRVLPGCTSGCFEYFYKDYQGNVRVAYGDSLSNLTTRQRRDYDPWGLELANSSGYSTNRLGFNGKELLKELGGGLLDYGARLFDAARGQWGVVDPLSEKAPAWSGYRYGFDNPINVIDPDGKFEYSDGYSTQDSKYTTGALSFNGVFQNNNNQQSQPLTVALLRDMAKAQGVTNLVEIGSAFEEAFLTAAAGSVTPNDQPSSANNFLVKQFPNSVRKEKVRPDGLGPTATRLGYGYVNRVENSAFYEVKSGNSVLDANYATNNPKQLLAMLDALSQSPAQQFGNSTLFLITPAGVQVNLTSEARNYGVNLLQITPTLLPNGFISFDTVKTFYTNPRGSLGKMMPNAEIHMQNFNKPVQINF